MSLNGVIFLVCNRFSKEFFAVTGAIAVFFVAMVLPISAADNVAGNLIQFNSDGNWSWFMDERSIVDPVSQTLLISSQSSSNFTGIPGGTVLTTAFSFDTGLRTRVVMRDGQEDDHNAGGLLILPDGRYLTMYSHHGNTSGLGDEFSHWRISTNSHDATSWAAQQTFNWNDPAQNPGRNPTGGDQNNVTYHNLFHLAGDINNPNDDRIFNISRATGQAPNILEYNTVADTMSWRGQLLTNTVGGYSTGYLKYASNNTDKVYFISTETHPRNYNNSIYAGYLSIDGKSYRMDGTLIDSNSFDNAYAGGGSGVVPDVTSFTPVQQADPLGGGFNRLWTTDLAVGPDNTSLYALYTSRFNNNDTDHRLHYARWDGTGWQTHEIARMGDKLYGPEQDYTGLGAIDPDNPNVLYISTPINPATGVATTNHEIYKGVTANGGVTWTWTPITSNSTVDNLRPIVPKWDANNTAVVWFRGVYNTAHDIDAAVVGVVDRGGEHIGLIRYVDAVIGSGGNTTLGLGGGAVNATGPSAAEGPADADWHRRTGVGNGDDVLTAGGSGQENAPILKTTLAGLADGVYDIFAYFWANPSEDWRIEVSFDIDDRLLIRDNGAQQAELAQFHPDDAGSMVIQDIGNTFLYRVYVGRTTISDGSSIDVFINDASLSNASGGTTRTWYDGLGYAEVFVPEPSAGVLLGFGSVVGPVLRRQRSEIK